MGFPLHVAFKNIQFKTDETQIDRAFNASTAESQQKHSQAAFILCQMQKHPSRCTSMFSVIMSFFPVSKYVFTIKQDKKENTQSRSHIILPQMLFYLEMHPPLRIIRFRRCFFVVTLANATFQISPMVTSLRSHILLDKCCSFYLEMYPPLGVVSFCRCFCRDCLLRGCFTFGNPML